MTNLQKFLSLVLVIFLGVVMYGCGGGGGAAKGTINGQITLPGGTDAKHAVINDLTTLTVQVGNVTTHPDANGDYTATVSVGTNIEITVIAPSGNVLLKAIVPELTKGATVTQDIDTATTAVALIYKDNPSLTIEQIELATNVLPAVETAIVNALTDATVDSIIDNTGVTNAVDTASNTIGTNQLPVISSLTADPTTVDPEGTSTVTCTATDADVNDTLTYTWDANGGTITGTGSQVTWTAPATPGEYTITVEVSDGKGGDVETVNITVRDNIPPTVSDVSVANITSSGATITWTTDEASTSQVEYGETFALGSETTENTNKVTSHSVNLTGLSASTKYFFVVKSKDEAGNIGTESGSFTTESATGEDTTGPAIYNVSASDVTDTSATITWTTDEPATSQVLYGTSEINLDQSTTEDTNLVTAHSVPLTGLTSDTWYAYQVISKDASANPSDSGPRYFHTLPQGETDTLPPLIISLSPSDGSTVSGNVIIFVNAEDNVAVAQYEFFIDELSVGTNNSGYSMWDTTSLANSSQHTIKVIVSDAAGNSTISDTNTVTVDNANTATISGTVTFTGGDASGAFVFVSTTGEGEPDGPLTVTDTDGNFTLTGIQPGTWYYTAVKDVNGDGLIECGDAMDTQYPPSQIGLAADDNMIGLSITIAVQPCGPKQKQKAKVLSNVLKKKK